jgi:hypothetical protein
MRRGLGRSSVLVLQALPTFGTTRLRLIALLVVLVLTLLVQVGSRKHASEANEQRIDCSEHRQKGKDRKKPGYHVWLVRHLFLLLGDFLKSVTRKEGPARKRPRPHGAIGAFADSTACSITSI